MQTIAVHTMMFVAPAFGTILPHANDSSNNDQSLIWLLKLVNGFTVEWIRVRTLLRLMTGGAKIVQGADRGEPFS